MKLKTETASLTFGGGKISKSMSIIPESNNFGDDIEAELNKHKERIGRFCEQALKCNATFLMIVCGGDDYNGFNSALNKKISPIAGNSTDPLVSKVMSNITNTLKAVREGCD